jgi:protein-tyrosine phosphatase
LLLSFRYVLLYYRGPVHIPKNDAGQLPIMIDIHNHVLPGIDDGAADMAESIEMCRIASQDGIKVIVATPHSFDGNRVTDPGLIRRMVKDLNQALQAKGVDVKVLPGMETRVGPDLPELLSADRVVPLNQGGYVLLEFDRAHVPAGFDRLVSRLRELGYGIVLGHPEKNLRLQSDQEYLPKLMDTLGAWDLIIQISADSLTGAAGRQAYKAARFLLKRGLVHVIATDAYSVAVRPPLLSPALVEAGKIVGEARARQMVHDIPLAVLKGIGFPKLEEPRPSKRWWRIFS